MKLNLLKGRNFRSKLMVVMMASSSATLILAGLAYVGLELERFRSTSARELAVVAQIVGQSSTAALTFQDGLAARENLAALRGERHIVAAALYTLDGKVLADYSRDGGTVLKVPAPAPAGSRIDGFTLTQFHDVVLSGERVGKLWLRRDLSDARERIRQSIPVMAGILAVCLLVAFLIASEMQKTISKPIISLAHVVRRVTAGEDYSVRADKLDDDEIGFLVDQFNEMMQRVHSRDLELQQAHDELEARVQARTSELQEEIHERRRVERDLLVAKQAAEESNHAKSAFLATMSHELRTPLNAIIGYSEMLEEDAEADGNAEAAADLRKILSSARHLLALISDVLDISKIEAGRMALHIERVDVSPIVEDCLNTVQPLAAKNGNRVVHQAPVERLEVEVDTVKFRQSLLNLLSNACKFTENGTITLEEVHADRDGRRLAEWRVRDTGVGISKEQQAKLFSSFTQVDSSFTRRHGGSGLGLAISKRLCQLMGGDVTLESEAGKGSTFTICLPLPGEAETGDLPDSLDRGVAP